MAKVYDENQLAAIEAYGGHFLVLAPPGCGKTDILAERIARARMRGVDFDDILCLTFTNRASRGMKARIGERVGEGADNIFVGNVHRFCSHYIFSNKLISQSTGIIDEDDQIALFKSFDGNYFLFENLKLNKNAVKYVSDLVSYIEQARLSHPKEVCRLCDNCEAFYDIALGFDFDPDRIPAGHTALIVALQYIRYKESQRLIDFDDILILAYDHLLRNDHKRYPWIQVDEVQDLNSLQLAIVDLLTAEDATVMYLGDEQQAIFSFMGAKLELLDILRQRCAGNILTLGNNYRAPSYLLDVCNKYAEMELNVDPALLPRPVNMCEKGKYDLVLAKSNSVDDEKQRVLQMVNYYLSLDPKEHLAILVPKNNDADVIGRIIEAARIPYFKISGTDMFRTVSFKAVASFLVVSVNNFDSVAWSRLLLGIGAVRNRVAASNFMASIRPLMMTPFDLISDETFLMRFCRRYTSEEFVVFDTETTGVNVLVDDIVQIAAFKVKNGVKVEGSDFNILLQTDKTIPPMLGDIVNPLVKHYASNPRLSREEGLRLFLDYVGDCPVLGHNVSFDCHILKNNVVRTLGIDISLDAFDSLHLVRLVYPDLRSYKLESLISSLGLAGQNSHLANEDIEATKSLVDHCLPRALSVLSSQATFLAKPRVCEIAAELRSVKPVFDYISSYLDSPHTRAGVSLHDIFHQIYSELTIKDKIKPISKFNVFLRYVESEWDSPSSDSTLTIRDIISTRLCDLTATLTEADLVGSATIPSDCRVFIMTVYKGKGLEFDNVIVLGAIRGNYPYFAVVEKLNDPNATADERRRASADLVEDSRKFYVALSRAKKRLCVSFTGYNAHGYPVCITPFINSIRNHFISI